MSRVTLVFLVAGLVLATTLLWVFGGGTALMGSELPALAGVIILVAFAVFVGWKRLQAVRRREPQEDELTRAVIRKAAALSYFVSLYGWLVLMYVGDKYKLEPEPLIGSGIIGMGLLFAGSWLFYHFKGGGHE
ncbi:MAG TPA: hypothetical protein PKE63_02380 [Lacibacter sp.]|nr:hypothetical protein [Lacibacter sp.]HMO90177.1 hypothetical protein [Lacibacter sp.]HMP86092.1 hypothetical protein [Lacibacter sp.]